ncbi:DEAD/DEAH box helicase [Lachnoclostridium phytofermentans]|uniref:DEAD/DEAH box helicase domain protein n=1 Tax=Lachnoclostridium phytofermentans (strain ATCC 700394 / DSM 18823 / ISDg) TaxID=357809 RepID=A9KIX6_LACP7|nr:DEAD/DEAH box helicase [Lachnoclostridium phytofermentans]ABX40975.1 DEAD/DEAH box helicase domain protein [Lachnoclostridium phytofermentans ISDg]
MREIGIRKTHDRLTNKLVDYIKAQYFAENDLLTDAADELLFNEDTIFQEPFIEVTKNYKMSQDGFNSSRLDLERKNILNQLTNAELGVFVTPFNHQIKAIEQYYSSHDVMVTTGTGSGKTECFLWPILTDLIYEARTNEASWEQEGIRALVLYPMNALVSDQLGRMRNIIGRKKDDAYHKILCNGKYKRRARFGMYTGRTPYAGNDNADKNKDLGKVIEKNYLKSEVYEELLKVGRIPSKDLTKFAEHLSRGVQVTGKLDSELYTRGEMQKICPDILITNYSMLEYMLMRPIEEELWSKTIKWLNASEDNKLLLVIDEAHMYRGASGGEVALLIRRLMNKLNISSNKMKCILTSASVPYDKNDELQKFACGLTGRVYQENQFSIVREEIKAIKNAKRGTYEQAQSYAGLSLESLQSEVALRKGEYEKISRMNQWSKIPKDEIEISRWLYDNLSCDSLMKQIITICEKGAKPLSKIAKEVFEDNVPKQLAEQALERLLQLGITAKSSTNKVLLGSKVHMMFKGLQGIYVCTNPNCKKLHSGMGIYLGYISSKYTETCPECNGRMYELMMDRRCGTLYIRAFDDQNIENYDGLEFLWSRNNQIMKEPKEIHLWIMPEGRIDFFKLGKKTGKAKKNSTVGYLDSKTGLLFRDESHAGDEGYLKVLISSTFNEDVLAFTFNTCPNCGRDHNKITPFLTRGNEPFANIVKEQFEVQPDIKSELKNGGKKVLLFSDSRQRAATLARDMTIASDGDSGRQAIFMAQKLLDDSSGESTIDLLYYAFLKVVYDNKLSFFYGKEKEMFKRQLKKYEELYSSRTIRKFDRLKSNIGNPPDMFYQLLLKNISDSYRSLNNLGLAQVVLADQGDAGEEIEYQILEKVENLTGISGTDVYSIYNTWIQYLIVNKIAIFPEIGDDVRDSILAYERGRFGIDEIAKFPEFLNDIIKEKYDESVIQALIDRFDDITQILQSPGRNHNRRYLFGTRLILKAAENSEWIKCDRCAGISTYTLWGHCIYCGSTEYVRKVDDEHFKRYLLWRKPVIDALNRERIHNIITEEHTAQLSYKDNKKDVWGTTEKYELAFRNITLNEDEEPIDVLSCTTTMEVGIDIGSLTSVGLRNVPPMRENYQQRAGRAGRAGAAVSSIVTYTENGPHDSWYFKHPEQIISGIPRTPWIDDKNTKLIRRHINLIFLQEFFYTIRSGLDVIRTLDFFSYEDKYNYIEFLRWLKERIPMSYERQRVLIPTGDFNWKGYYKEISKTLENIADKVDEAPFIFEQTSRSDENESDSVRLIDVLFSEGVLPNYSFPRNIVHFWIEDLYGNVKESPERSVDIALSEYAPGRSLVVNKQTYISGGIYDHYTKYHREYKYKAAEPWLELDEYKKVVSCCTNPLCGWFGVNETYDECPLCKNTLEKHTMIKPWGFTAREGKSIPETHESQELSYVSVPSYSSMPSGIVMSKVGSAGYAEIENRENQKLVIVNRGPEDKGFEMCSICGAIEPSIGQPSDRNNRKRPYRNLYIKDDTMRCHHNYSNIFLGYEFNTDMMVLVIKLDSNKVDLSTGFNIWLIPALTTFAEALVLAASRELDVEFSDVKSGYRIRMVGSDIYADIYLYDGLSSGAGYAVKVSEVIESVLNRMKEIFEGCNCSASCPNCLEHYWNQRNKGKLDRFLGKDFLEFITSGKLRTEVTSQEKKYYIDQINHIAQLQGYGIIFFNRNGKYIINSRQGEKEVIIYPSMCNSEIFEGTDKLFLSDRLCRYAMPEIWNKVRNEVW